MKDFNRIKISESKYKSDSRKVDNSNVKFNNKNEDSKTWYSNKEIIVKNLNNYANSDDYRKIGDASVIIKNNDGSKTKVYNDRIIVMDIDEYTNDEVNQEFLDEQRNIANFYFKRRKDRDRL